MSQAINRSPASAAERMTSRSTERPRKSITLFGKWVRSGKVRPEPDDDGILFNRYEGSTGELAK